MALALLGVIGLVRAEPATTVAPLSANELRAQLAREHGHVVLLNLWATWCVSCLREIPDLISLQRELEPRGLSVIGVAMDEPGELESLVKPFHAQHFPAFRTYLRSESDIDAIASVVDNAWNEVLPTTYVIDRQGKVVERLQGTRSLKEFRERAERVLKGNSAF